MYKLVNRWKSRLLGVQILGVDGKQVLLVRVEGRTRCTTDELFHGS